VVTKVYLSIEWGRAPQVRIRKIKKEKFKIRKSLPPWVLRQESLGLTPLLQKRGGTK
jgi:hypothetical protein